MRVKRGDRVLTNDGRVCTIEEVRRWDKRNGFPINGLVAYVRLDNSTGTGRRAIRTKLLRPLAKEERKG